MKRKSDMTEENFINKYAEYMSEVSAEKLGKYINIHEISKGTLQNYISKAGENKKEIVNDTSFKNGSPESKYPNGVKQIVNRSKGMVLARSKSGAQIHGYKKGPPKVLASEETIK